MGLIGFSTCSPITVGCNLYQNSTLSIPVADGRYSDGTAVYVVSGGAGQVSSINSCSSGTTTTSTTSTSTSTTTTTTTCPPSVSTLLTPNTPSCFGLSGACATGLDYTVYSTNGNIQIGTTLYADECLTTPVDAGFYGDAGGTGSGNCIEVNASGVVVAITQCETITTTTLCSCVSGAKFEVDQTSSVTWTLCDGTIEIQTLPIGSHSITGVCIIRGSIAGPVSQINYGDCCSSPK